MITPRPRVVVSVVVSVVAFLAIAGCVDSGGFDRSTPPPLSNGEPVWLFWPERLRIHPLTRVVTEDDDNRVLEIRIELFDGDGHTTRGLGVLRVELQGVRMPVSTWERDLNDLATNRLHFDDVTRTYLLRLEVTTEQVSPAPTIRATLQTPDGRVLVDEAAVPGSGL